MPNSTGAVRLVDPVRGTRFNWGRNRPPQIERIIRAIEKEARAHGYIENRRMIATIAMRVAPDEYKTQEIGDELVQFVLHQGMCIEETGTRHCYPDVMRNIEIFQALGARQRVEDPGDAATRLAKMKQNFSRKQRKERRRVGKGIATTAAKPAVTEALPRQMPPNIVTVETDVTTAAAEPTLHEVLRQLKAHYGWPLVDRMPTIVMQAVSGALHPNYGNSSTAPSHWRMKGLLSNLGSVRKSCAIWEVREVVCVCSWQEATKTRALTADEVSDLLKVLFEGHGDVLAQAIDDVCASMRKWPVGGADVAPRIVLVEKTPPVVREDVVRVVAPVKATLDLETVEAQLRELLALRRPLRLAERQKQLREQVDALAAEAGLLVEREQEEERIAQEARQNAQRHEEAAARLREELTEKQCRLQQYRERLKVPVPA